NRPSRCWARAAGPGTPPGPRPAPGGRPAPAGPPHRTTPRPAPPAPAGAAGLPPGESGSSAALAGVRLLQVGNEIAWPMAAVQLLAKDAVPGGAAGVGRAGQAAH